MNRKLMLLNAVLGALAIWAAVEWRSEYVAARAREHKMYTARVPAQPTAPLAPLPKQPDVQAANYNDVAQKLLLHPSRNPDIPVEPPPAPPPPEPMPPLPLYHGQMNLDGSVVAILSVTKDAVEEVKPGETIGQFKLVDVNTRDITFQWKDQQVRKTLDEMLASSSKQRGDNSAPSSASAPVVDATPPPPAIRTEIGPVGDVSQFGRRACDPNDSYSEGAVVDGWRKVLSPTPFGKACFWERAGK